MITLNKIFTIVAVLLPMPLIANEATAEIQKVPGVIGASSILQIVAGLFLVLAIIIGAGWLLKRYGGIGGMSNANLKVIAGITVGQREKIVIVQAGDVQVLVGIAPGSIRTLHVLENNIDGDTLLKVSDPAGEDKGNNFSSHLQQQVKRQEEL